MGDLIVISPRGWASWQLDQFRAGLRWAWPLTEKAETVITGYSQTAFRYWF